MDTKIDKWYWLKENHIFFKYISNINFTIECSNGCSLLMLSSRALLMRAILPSVFLNFFVCTNEIEILCDPRCMERLQCVDFQVHRNILWSNEPCDLALTLARHTMLVLFIGGKIYMTCWLLTQEVWQNWFCYKELVPSFHDFFQLNNSPCQSTTLLKATLLLNENQVLLFSFKLKVKELPLLILLPSPRLTRGWHFL